MIWSWMKYENCKKIVRIERRSRQAGKTCKRWLMCEVYMTHMNIFIIFLISSWGNKSKTFDIAHLFWVLYTYTFIPVVWASVFVFTERDIKVKLLSIKRYHNKLLCAKDCNCIFFLKFDWWIRVNYLFYAAFHCNDDGEWLIFTKNQRFVKWQTFQCCCDRRSTRVGYEFLTRISYSFINDNICFRTIYYLYMC